MTQSYHIRLPESMLGIWDWTGLVQGRMLREFATVDRGAMRAYGEYNLAVVLNDNAKNVTQLVREKIHELVPERNIFYSKSLEDSARLARELTEAEVEVVFTGGGDGTVIQFMNDLIKLNAERLPTLGILPLGTGNGLASMVSSGNYLYDLETYILKRQVDYQPLRLLEGDGAVFPFTGLGVDAAILNDYVHIKERYGSNPLVKPFVQNVGGYLVASFSKTVPRLVWHLATGQKATARVINKGDVAYECDVEGKKIREYGPGEVIYEGTAIMISAATAPYYGYGMKIFPNVMRHPGYFEVRLVLGGVGRIVAGLGKVWKGRFVTDKVRSLVATHVATEFDREVPFQIGGDAKGFRSEVAFKLHPQELRLLRFV
jgi:diacylglycerol kinase family enzyme